MKMIQDQNTIQRLERICPLERCFTPGLCPHHYRVYEKGELLQSPSAAMRHLHILLSGSVQVYSLTAGGQRTPVATIGPGATVGEVELMGLSVPFYAEAVRRVECLTLSAEDCRRFLRDDPVFLRFLLLVIAQKQTFASCIGCAAQRMPERVLSYLRVREDHQISRLGEAAFTLHCSRSTLQRTLALLCQEEKVRRCRRGVYRLCPEAEEEPRVEG